MTPMFGKMLTRPPPQGAYQFNYKPHQTGLGEGRLKLHLVVDPYYRENRQRLIGNQYSFAGIPICRREKILTSKIRTYNLSWNVSANILSPKRLIIFTGAALFKPLCLDPTDPEVLALRDGAGITISAFEAKQNGAAVHNTANKKWRLWVAINRSTGWLVMRHIQRLNCYCNECAKEVTSFVRSCRTCPLFSLCLPYSVLMGADDPHELTALMNLKE